MFLSDVDFNLYQLVLLVTITLLCVCFLSRNRYPPGPYGLPVVGYYPFVGNNSLKTIDKLTKKYGRIFGLNLLGKQTYFLNDLETVENVFIKNWNKTLYRPQSYTAWCHVTTNKSITFGFGNSWKFHRRLLLHSLFPVVGQECVEAKILKVCHNLIDHLQVLSGHDVDTRDHLSQFGMNIVTSLTYSTTYELGDQRSLELKRLGLQFFALMPGFNAHLSGPIFHLLSLLNFQRYRKLSQLREDYQAFFRPVVTARLRESDSKLQRNDVLQKYIELLRAEDQCLEDVHLDQDIICDVLYSMAVGGAETIGTTLYHAQHLMVLNIDVQTKVQQEIDHMVGTRPICLSDKKLLPYTQAVISEIQRYACVFPYATQREVSDDISVDNFVINKGSIVMPNLRALSRNSKYFANPNKFYPEHFLRSDGTFGKNPANLPFGVGARLCVAYKLAQSTLFLAFANLMQKFEFYRPECGDSIGKQATNLTNTLQPFRVKLVVR